MSYHCKFTEEAANRLFEIAKWYLEASQSIDVATVWYDGFLDALETLEQNPWRGSIAAENELFGFELRELLYGSGKRLTHRALYRVVGNVVEVLSIRHHAERPIGPDDLA